jgi:hypothetical protein
MASFMERQTELFQFSDEPQLGTDQDQVTPPVKVFQDFLLRDSVWAVKEAASFDTLRAFRDHLIRGLPQNSAVTRERYAQSILKWFFSDGTTRGFATRTWIAYADHSLLVEVNTVVAVG